MVVFVDLEDDISNDPNDPREFSSLRRHHLADKVTTKVTANGDDESTEERPNPNVNSFSAALGAYPYVCPPYFLYPSKRTMSQLTEICNLASSPN